MQIKILWVGKTKNLPIRELLADYLERLRHLVPIEIVEVRDLSKGRGLQGARLKDAEGGELRRFLPPQSRVVALDERGRQFSSTEFAKWFSSEQDMGTREICFVIGGPDGVSETIFKIAHLKLSLGKMTWTHEICRVLLVEQVYRAFTILRNIPYHK